MNEQDYIWVKDTDWVKLDKPKSCRYMVLRRDCGKGAIWALKRGQTKQIWAYCPEHMGGRRIRDGIIEVQVHKDSISAKRGYV